MWAARSIVLTCFDRGHICGAKTMPTYEYACSSCGNAWEEVQKITEPALEVCPACNKSTAKRQISGGNFILKGGGWYADAYSTPKSSSKGKEESSAKSSDGGTSAGGGGVEIRRRREHEVRDEEGCGLLKPSHGVWDEFLLRGRRESGSGQSGGSVAAAQAEDLRRRCSGPNTRARASFAVMPKRAPIRS